MQAQATLFTDVKAGAITDDREHFMLVFSNADGTSSAIAMPIGSIDALKKIVDDLKHMQAGTPEDETVQ